MPWNSRLIEGLLLPAVLVAYTACSDDPAAPECSPGVVQGSISGFSAPVFDEAGGITGFRVDQAAVAGDLEGNADAELTIVSVDEQGTLELDGSHTFRDAAEVLLFRTTDNGLTTADGRIENHLTVVEGGTGTLDTEGTVDLQTGALELQYVGDICLQ